MSQCDNVTHPLWLDTNLQPGLNIGMCCVTPRKLLLWWDPTYLHLFPFLKLIILKNALFIIIVLDLLPGRLALVRQVSDQKFGLGIIDHMHNTWSPYQSDHLSVQWSRWCIWDTTASSQIEINNGCLLSLFFSIFMLRGRSMRHYGMWGQVLSYQQGKRGRLWPIEWKQIQSATQVQIWSLWVFVIVPFFQNNPKNFCIIQ